MKSAKEKQQSISKSSFRADVGHLEEQMRFSVVESEDVTDLVWVLSGVVLTQLESWSGG